MSRFRMGKITAILGLLMIFALPASAFAARGEDKIPFLKELQEIKPDATNKLPDTGDIVGVEGLQIRRQAQREAALSYGARGGLSRRSYEIGQLLGQQEDILTRVFDFRQLLITAPSGLLIEPPVIGEAADALLVREGGQEAAVADRVYNINRPARIVTAPRDWHTYLERGWGPVDPPPDILLPQNNDERREWRIWVEQGWNQGYEQGDATFQADLDRLTADFTGMIRYRLLLAQGIITEPYALHEDRGITGGGSEMRVGDRAVRITGPSQLQSRGFLWIPADRR